MDEYLITSIDDFLQVPQDRLAACLIEFHDYMAALRLEREVACQAAIDATWAAYTDANSDMKKRWAKQLDTLLTVQAIRARMGAQ
jgi:hypothetical protein